VAWVEEVPGVNTQGRTMKEARENLRDALELVLDENRRYFAKEFKSAKRESLILSA